jgi:hypothetical protein
MARLLELAGAVAAIVAAGFWFISANGEVPQMLAYWDGVPAKAQLDRWAAGFGGLSALFVAARLFLSR